MLLSIGISRKIVNIINKLYENTECAVTIDGKLTEWFCVLIGLRQGCLLSPTLFNIFLEFVLKEIKCVPQHLAMNNKELAQIIKYADDTYASETWVLTVKEENKLNVFEMRCLRAILCRVCQDVRESPM